MVHPMTAARFVRPVQRATWRTSSEATRGHGPPDCDRPRQRKKAVVLMAHHYGSGQLPLNEILDPRRGLVMDVSCAGRARRRGLMDQNTVEYKRAIESLEASRQRADAILADPERVKLLSYESNGAVPMTADEFREKYGIKGD